ncbi:MAG: helix-turn-helix domain-containing protein [Geminicoccaceae bacterium]
MLTDVPDSWGPKFAGRAGEATLTRTGPAEIGFTAPAAMALVMLTPQPDRELALASDRKLRFFAPAGSVELVPAQAELFARWTVEKESLLLALAPERLARLVELEFGRADFALEPTRPGVVDARLHMLAQMAREEFRRSSPPDGDYLDSLLTVTATQLLRRFSSLRHRPRRPYRGGLTPRARRRVQDLIHADLSRRLGVAELAAEAGLSPSHFMRAFRESVGLTPHQYVLRARLRHAEGLITATDLPLAAIARQAGFASHSHLSSTMQRLRATAPHCLRQQARKP